MRFRRRCAEHSVGGTSRVQRFPTNRPSSFYRSHLSADNRLLLCSLSRQANIFPMTALLETRALIKHFRGVLAVNGIDLALPAGRCFGLLGPNGAGKTTTVEILEGIQQPRCV